MAKARPIYSRFKDPDGKAAKLVDSIVTDMAEMHWISRKLEADKAELRASVMPQFLKAARDKAKLPQGIAVAGQTTAGVRLCMFRQVCGVIPGTLPQFADEWFCEHHHLRSTIIGAVNGDIERIMTDVSVALKGYGAPSWISKLRPKQGFHTQRHKAFSLDENLALDEVAPIPTRILAG